MIDETSWIVRTTDERPARMDGTCFYCSKPMGEKHTEDCVIPGRSVVVRFSVELVLEASLENSSKDAIEFRYNEGTWCGSNLIRMLRGLHSRLPCLCGFVKAEYLRDATQEDHDAQNFKFDDRDKREAPTHEFECSVCGEPCDETEGEE